MIKFLFFILLTFTLPGAVKAQYNSSTTNSTKQVVLYPNPANSIVNIKFTDYKKIEQLSIYTLIGNEVYSFRNQKSNTLAVNVGSLVRGKYIVRVVYNNGTSESLAFIKN